MRITNHYMREYFWITFVCDLCTVNPGVADYLEVLLLPEILEVALLGFVRPLAVVVVFRLF